MVYDVLLVGGGVIGGMLARELTRYKLNVVLLEKENDVAMGASKANSGIIHGGFDPVPNTLKAKLNKKGISLLYKAAKELNVPYKNCGSFVCAYSSEEEKHLETLLSRGKENGIEGLEIISGDKARELEPNLSTNVTAALNVKNSGIICPYSLTIAAVGNAMDNGAELKLNFEVESAIKSDGIITLKSKLGEEVKGRFVVNCAGIGAKNIAKLFSDNSIELTARAGEYMLLDKTEGQRVSRTIFGVPSKAGKGILVSPTAEGNLLLGPTAEERDYEDKSTTIDGLSAVAKGTKKAVPNINLSAVITSFCGVRATPKGDDFIIKQSESEPNLLNLAGIESPGLTCSASIAELAVTKLAEMGLKLTKNDNFNPYREDVFAFRKMTKEEKNEFIKNNSDYGRVVCRCEGVSEGEIKAALNRNPKPLDFDGVKRRTRMGMGRCQGGFCTPTVLKIMAENSQDILNVTKKGSNSEFLSGKL